MNNTLRYVMYCRKSTDSEDRQIQSLDTQERLIMDIVQRDGLIVVGIPFKESMSAKKKGRPVFNQVMKLIENGKADAILCYKLDRLARNFIDGGKIIDGLQKSVIKEIRTCEGIYKPTDNVLPIAVAFGTANQYILDLSASVKDGNKTKLLEGGWPGNAPFGYLNDKAEKTIIIDSKRAPYVKRMFDLYANDGKSYGQISDILFKEGLRTNTGNKVYKSNIQRIISSKFYMGIMERDGKYFSGKYEPLVSKDLFDKAQDIADNKSRPRPKTLSFAFSGFLKCENCGCVLTATRVERKTKKYDYYYCTNGKGGCDERKNYMRENYLYEKVGDVLGKLAFDLDLIEMMYQEKLERSTETNQYSENVLNNLHKELKLLTEREGRLFDIFLNGDIDKPVYEEKLLEFKNKKVELNHEIEKHKTDNPTVTFEQIKNLFIQGSNARNEFINGEIDKKKEVLQSVLSNISIKGQEIVTVQYKSPFNLLANSPKNLTFLTGLRRTCSEKPRLRPVRSFLIFSHYDFDALRAL